METEVKEKKSKIPGYPKAKFRRAKDGEGDLREQYSQNRHPYVSSIAETPQEEKALGVGWYDNPAQIPDEKAN